MADYNWAADSESTKSSSYTFISSLTFNQGGSTADIFDNDSSTNQWLQGYYLGAGNTAAVDLTSESDFNAKTINSIVGIMYGGGHNVTSLTYSISAYYSGGWNVVGSGSYSPGDYTVTLSSLGLTGVSKVKMYLYGSAASSAHDDGTVVIRAYELQAWGPKYIDIGLRVNKSDDTVVTVGAAYELNATHKLRIRKGSTTYGIPLVATTDADASGLRIYDGAAVKSLPKLS
jgi:hypothetical protein